MELLALNLADDFKEAQAVEDSKRWELVLAGPLEVLATVSPRTAPTEKFQARLQELPRPLQSSSQRSLAAAELPGRFV